MFWKLLPKNKSVSVNIIYPMGLKVEMWTIGRDIDVDTYRKFIDPVTKELHALVHFENGVPVTSVLKKEMYDIAKDRVGEPMSEDDTGSIANRIMDDLGWGSSLEKETK